MKLIKYISTLAFMLLILSWSSHLVEVEFSFSEDVTPPNERINHEVPVKFQQKEDVVSVNKHLEYIDTVSIYDASEAIQQGGFATTDGIYDYVSNSYSMLGEIIKITRETGETKVLLETAASSLSCKDGWLYFINNSDFNGVYKMRTDGSQVNKLLDGWVDELYLIDDELYYIPIDKGHVIEKMSLEGEFIDVFINNQSRQISFWDENVYFTDYSYRLCVKDLKEVHQMLTPDVMVWNYTVNPGGIYYFDYNDDVMHIGHNQLIKKLSNKKYSKVHFAKHNIFMFYEDIKNNNVLSIHKMNYDGSGEEVVFSDKSINTERGMIQIGDTLYFYLNNPKYYRAEYLCSLKDGVLVGPLNEKSLKLPDKMKKSLK